MPQQLYMLFFLLIIVMLFLSSMIKVVREYERGVVFRLGRPALERQGARSDYPDSGD